MDQEKGRPPQLISMHMMFVIHRGDEKRIVTASTVPSEAKRRAARERQPITPAFADPGNNSAPSSQLGFVHQEQGTLRDIISFLVILSLKYSLRTCQFAMLKTPIYRSNPSAFTASHLLIPRPPIILPHKNLATNRTLSINLSKQAQIRSRRNDPQKFE